MKFPDRATEREWIRLASEGRKGGPIQPKDPGTKLKYRLGLLLQGPLLAFVISGFLGSLAPEIRTAHWQTLLSSLILMFMAMSGAHQLMRPINSRPGYVAAFLNLPISGNSLVRWVRKEFWIERSPRTLLYCTVISWGLHGFDFSAPWGTAATTLLLTAITFSTMIVRQEEWLERYQIGRLWTILIALLVISIVVLFFTNREVFLVGQMPDWMADGILHLSWIFPPSWCLPGRFENGGALLALPWIAWGTARWISWPKRAGIHFDTMQDVTPFFGDFSGEDEDDFPESDELLPDTETASPPFESAAGKFSLKIDSLESLTMQADGWVERWVRFLIGRKYATLAGAMVHSYPLWTQITNQVIRYAAPTLVFAWAFHRYFPESKFKSTADLWIGIIAFVLTLGALLPVTNEVPRATYRWLLGGQALPVFSMLPISVRDVLRVSMRITLARGLIMVPLMTPVIATLLFIYEDLGYSPWMACWLVPAFTFFWVASRPVFLCSRLQETTRRCNSLLLYSLLQLLILCPSSFGWWQGPWG